MLSIEKAAMPFPMITQEDSEDQRNRLTPYVFSFKIDWGNVTSQYQ